MKSARQFALVILLLYTCGFAMAIAIKEPKAENPGQKKEHPGLQELRVEVSDNTLCISPITGTEAVVRIYDPSGVLLISKTVQEPNSTLELNALLETGRYYLSVVDGKGSHYYNNIEVSPQSSSHMVLLD